MSSLVINVLDQSPIAEGSSAQAAIAETISLAEFCESLGYHRYWVAEHHNTPAFAGAAPEILIAHLAAKTSKMHIGSGGIMISHYSPLKIAEQFRSLASLAPGRIDLGIGRAPGGDARTSAALQAGPRAWPPEVFPQQVEMIKQFLEDAAGLSGQEGGFPADHPYQGIHAQPSGGPPPSMWLLGSGGDSAVYAAQFGLPYVYADFIGGPEGRHVIDLYRRNFSPSPFCPEAKIGFALSVLAAPSQAEADYYSASRNLWAVQFRLGQAARFLPSSVAAAYTFNETEAMILSQVKARTISGTGELVAEQLRDLKIQHQVDEFFLVTITPDAPARRNSYALVAQATQAL